MARQPPALNFGPLQLVGCLGLLRVYDSALARHDPLPREAVRDLLGITRALYRAERAKPGTSYARLEQLLEIGKQFRLALDLSKYEPDTMGGRAARSWAEKATAALGEIVADSELMAPAVAATAERLRRAR
jgi:hypothetical protein